jgi:hypothetical protein
MAAAGLSPPGKLDFASAIGKRRAFYEAAIAFALIMVVIWTPRPAQRILWLVAVAAIAVMTAGSFKALPNPGLRTKNFLRSFWIVGVAAFLAIAAVAAAINLETLHLPAGGVWGFIKTYWLYAVWAGVQQFLLQAFFLPRFLCLFDNYKAAALFAAGLFALAHLPNPILAPLTLVWGIAACLVFLRYRNLYPLALAHAFLGIAITITVPGPIDHNMRVGLGYVTYRHHHPPRLTSSAQP